MVRPRRAGCKPGKFRRDFQVHDQYVCGKVSQSFSATKDAKVLIGIAVLVIWVTDLGDCVRLEAP